MENRLLEAQQLLKLLETAVAQAKEAVLITSACLDPPGPEILCIDFPADAEILELGDLFTVNLPLLRSSLSPCHPLINVCLFTSRYRDPRA